MLDVLAGRDEPAAAAFRRPASQLGRGRVPAGRGCAVEYGGTSELRGPLLVAAGVSGVGWDEFAMIRTCAGEAGGAAAGELRHGLVLEVDRDLAVVQVLRGHRRAGTADHPRLVLRIPAADPGRGRAGWGAICNGRGEPIDGGPPVSGTATAPVAGYPLNPTHRDPPAEPVLTGVSAIDALTTLVRGQKLPIFSVGRAAASGTGGPDRRPVDRGRRAVQRRVRRDGPDPRRRGRRAGGPRGALRRRASCCCCSTPPTTR